MIDGLLSFVRLGSNKKMANVKFTQQKIQEAKDVESELDLDVLMYKRTFEALVKSKEFNDLVSKSKLSLCDIYNFALDLLMLDSHYKNWFEKKQNELCFNKLETIVHVELVSEKLFGDWLAPSSSNGEKLVEEFLKENNINYIKEFTKNDLKHINNLRIDFYLPDYDVAIEFNGLQHYQPIDHFGGYSGYIKTIERDAAKYAWCKNNNVKLFIIRHDENVHESMKKIRSKLYKIDGDG